MTPDYRRLDEEPLLAQYLLFPRRDFTPPPPGAFDVLVKVEADQYVQVAARFYPGQEDWPWILYFHGNGEVAADYDYFCKMYHARRINLVVADYRGYGMSNGHPTFGLMAQDAHIVYRTVQDELSKRSYSPVLCVMGRSLGSLSALELAAHHQEELKGLIIESGFASVTRLISQWGFPIDMSLLSVLEQQCLEMIKSITIPGLVIHGERDSLVFPGEGRLLYETLGSSRKQWLPIPNADHNDIMLVNPQLYFQGIEDFVTSIGR